MDDFYEVKRRLETLAACRACRLMDEAGLRELEDIVEHQEFYAAKDDAEKIRDLDTNFHAAIYKYCGSRVLEKILSPLHRKIIKYRSASLKNSRDRRLESIKEHREIYEAIKERDEAKLERLMEFHIENAYKSICEFGDEQEIG